MATKIIPKKSSVDDKVPLTSDLDVGEIAINLADKKLFTKDGSDNIISLGNTEEQRIPIKADAAISKGDALYATGAVGASGKITVNKYIANNTIDEIYLIGLADRDLALGEIGYAITFGEIKTIDTTGTTVSETWVDGTVLYASPTTAGKLTNVQPDAPNQDITVAMVIRAHANTGILFVRPKQGYHLGELHDVYVPSPTDGQVLSWNNNNSRWEAATVEGGGGTTGASITASDTVPSSPSAGDLWFNSLTTELSVYYTDADSSQWVVMSGTPGEKGDTGATGPAGADGDITSSVLTDLSDVDTTGVVDGQVLSWNLANNQWEPADPSGTGGSAVITTSDTAPSNPSDGDAWFNTSDATLSVYYQDVDGGQWVVTSGPQGIPGNDGADGADGTNHTVYASDTPPVSPADGDTWFNTTEGAYYFYYNDGTSSQWVAISGPQGPEGPQGPAGSGVTTGKAIAMAIVFG